MMALRHRLTLLAAGTVGITVVLVATVAYFVLRHELRGQVDDAIAEQYTVISGRTDRVGFSNDLQLPSPPLRGGAPSGPAQLLTSDGQIFLRARGDLPVPVDGEDRAVAAGDAQYLLRDTSLDGVHLRVLTAAVPGGGAIQVARSLANVDATLARLRFVLLLLCAAGTMLAAALGRIFGRQVIQPVIDLTAAAEHITQTEDLGRRIDVPGDDEVGRMAQRFNTMLDTLEGSRRALDESVASQRQLVADASHELRTPVTALRTNIEVLLAGGELPEEDRRQLLEDVRAETEELGALITDVIELARGDEPLAGVEEVQLDALVAEAVHRASRRQPAATFTAELEPTVVEGVPGRLGRAVDNLLDNAVKHSRGDARVEVGLRGGALTVRDHGPGISAADRPYVFDRFYRGLDARGRPGSGLGLAIVRQVAETHGGSISVDAAPGGGAVFTLRLKALPPQPQGAEPAEQPEASPEPRTPA